MASSSTAIVRSGYFHVDLLDVSLNVILIPHEFIPKCAWWITRHLTRSSSDSSAQQFSSFIMDDDGLSLVCDSKSILGLRELLKNENFKINPQRWSALVVSLANSAFEFPGAVYYLADTLSQEQLSILHISTFESEVFLVHEEDVSKACTILKQSEDPGIFEERTKSKSHLDNSSLSPAELLAGLKDAAALSSNAALNYANISSDITANTNTTIFNATSSRSESSNSNNNNETGEAKLDMSWLEMAAQNEDETDPHNKNNNTDTDSLEPGDPHIRQSLALNEEGFSLSVLPNNLYLARLSDSASLAEHSGILINLLLYDKRFSALEKLLAQEEEEEEEEKVEEKESSSSSSSGSGSRYKNNSGNGSDGGKFGSSSDSSSSSSSGSSSSGSSSSSSSEPSPLDPSAAVAAIIDKGGSGSSDSDSRSRSGSTKSHAATFMWGMWQLGESGEVTFLLEEDDVARFPEGQLELSPQRWRVIKLTGRAIEFDETGVVSAMSCVDNNMPSLNISTASTNCTLVPEELLDATLKTLSATMLCPVYEVAVPS